MPTWLEIRTEIEDEYDLAEETFISADELMAYANEAIEDIEHEIQAVNPDYFLDDQLLAVTASTSEYALPTDIFANKIKLLMFDNGSKVYEIKPIRQLNIISDIQPGDDFRYLIMNSTADGTKLRLYPTPAENDSTSITIYYHRNAVRFADEADELDIPEAKSFIKQYTTDKAFNKEQMQPGAPESAALARKREQLITALKVMEPDDNNEALADMVPYYDQVGY